MIELLTFCFRDLETFIGVVVLMFLFRYIAISILNLFLPGKKP